MSNASQSDPAALKQAMEMYLRFLKANRPDDARSAMRELVQQFGDAGIATILQASSNLAVVSEDSCRQILQDLTNTAPDCEKAWANLGGALFRARKLEEAKEALKTAMQLDPNDEKPLNTYGAVIGTEGDIKTAYEFFYKAFIIRPDATKCRENLTKCCLQLLCDHIDPAIRRRSHLGYRQCMDRVLLSESPEYRSFLPGIQETHSQRDWEGSRKGVLRLLEFLELVIHNEFTAGNYDYVIDCLREKAHIYSGLADMEAFCGNNDAAIITLECAGALLNTFGDHPRTSHGRVEAQHNRIKSGQGNDVVAEARNQGALIVICPLCGKETSTPDQYRQLVRMAEASGRPEMLSMMSVTTNCMQCGRKFAINDAKRL